MWKKIIIAGVILIVVLVGGAFGTITYFSSDLPRMISVADYHPLLVSEVFDRNNDKVGEFFRESECSWLMTKFPKRLFKRLSLPRTGPFLNITA